MPEQYPALHAYTHLPDGSDPLAAASPSYPVIEGSIGPLVVASVPNTNIILPFPVDAVGRTFGAIQIPQITARFVFPIGAIFQLSNPAITNIDTTNDAYDLAEDVYIYNTDGTETLHLTGSAQANSGIPNDSCQISHATLSVVTAVGTDLSYSTTTGRVSSAAGGNYAGQLVLTGNWN